MLRRHAFLLCSSSTLASSTKVKVEAHIDRIHSELLRPSDSFGHTPKSTYAMPMVMLLGNHSAGKSTFINHLLGIEEQETGVAPTDDGFTVIMRGDIHLDTDGPSAVSSPQHQFGDLAQYGPAFVNRFRLKTRALPASSQFPNGMMIVDTPGMIDTPVHVQDRTTLEGQGRGYDFLAVTRWFAQRSDEILLMFDPANPGTTGETLDVLTKSLTGFEHKLSIIMNKVDIFDKVTDFARTYGTICWNLSKVIPMKDIPRIYTTFTPVLPQPGKQLSSSSSATTTNASSSSSAQQQQGRSAVGVPLHEMDRARREVLEVVLKAPLRRLDNLITELEEATKRVLLSGQVSTKLSRKFRARRSAVYGGIALTSVVLPIGMGSVFFTFDPTLIVLSSFVSVLLASGAFLLGKRHLTEYEKKLLATVDITVDELFPGKLKTAEVRQRWETSVKPALLEYLEHSNAVDKTQSGAVANLPTMSQRTMRKLESVSASDVPNLRTDVSAYKKDLLSSPSTGGSWKR
ncbi:dynamin, putative [Bodo saltans]|uniref:Dynamin, putative n=1 Tax=Bodo saltans TaxID=75058 RepID=A0A0S4IRJ8_BODSA|nr:dynamin, putative [Bodo saltans]|eukprot:CUE83139.1 dynamin, putative [Bodo saltans]